MHQWKEGLADLLRGPDLMYLHCVVTGDSAELEHGLVPGAVVVVVQDYDELEWHNPFKFYDAGDCCQECDEAANRYGSSDEIPTPALGVARLEEWERCLLAGEPFRMVMVSENDLGGLVAGDPIEMLANLHLPVDGGDYVWRLNEDGTADRTDTGFAWGTFENGDLEVFWDSNPSVPSRHASHTLTVAWPATPPA